MLQKVLILYFLHLAVGGIFKNTITDEYVCYISKDMPPISEESYFTLPCTHYIMHYYSLEVDGDKFDLDEDLKKLVESISQAKRRDPEIKFLISVHLELKDKSTPTVPDSYPAICEYYNEWDKKFNLNGLVVKNQMLASRAQFIAAIKTLRKCMDNKKDKLYLQGDQLSPNFYKKDKLYKYFDRVLVKYSRLQNNGLYLPPLMPGLMIYESILSIIEQWTDEGFKEKHLLGEVSLSHIIYKKTPMGDIVFLEYKYDSKLVIDAAQACEEAQYLKMGTIENLKMHYGENETHVLIGESPSTIAAKSKGMKILGLRGVFIWFLNKDSEEVLKCTNTSFALTKAASKVFSGRKIKNDVLFNKVHAVKTMPPVFDSEDNQIV